MGTFHTAHFERYANYSIDEMIDYWEITKDTKMNTTTTERDDHIHNNIMKKLADYRQKRILVICGFGHLNAQVERLMVEGGRKQQISNKSDLFKGKCENFVYPNMLSDVWEERVLFYAHTVPQLVQKNDTLNEETKANWPEDVDDSFYNWQMEYNKLFKENNLYKE